MPPRRGERREREIFGPEKAGRERLAGGGFGLAGFGSSIFGRTGLKFDYARGNTGRGGVLGLAGIWVVRWGLEGY